MANVARWAGVCALGALFVWPLAWMMFVPIQNVSRGLGPVASMLFIFGPAIALAGAGTVVWAMLHPQLRRPARVAPLALGVSTAIAVAAFALWIRPLSGM